MEGSQVSIVREPDWRPTLGLNSTTFRMVDLLLSLFKAGKTCSRRSATKSVKARIGVDFGLRPADER